jgi:hypothetical protein
MSDDFWNSRDNKEIHMNACIRVSLTVIAIAVVLVVAGCPWPGNSPPPGTSTLKLTIKNGETLPKNISPPDSDLATSSLHIILTKDDGQNEVYNKTHSISELQITISDLVPGSYSLTIRGSNSGGIEITEGSLNHFTVAPGDNEQTISLRWIDGNANFHLEIIGVNFPTDPSISVLVNPIADKNSATTLEPEYNDGKYVVDVNLRSGQWDLAVTVSASGKTKVFQYTLNIYANLNTNANLTITWSEDPTANLGLTIVIPAVKNVSISYDAASLADLPVHATRSIYPLIVPEQGISGLSVSLNGVPLACDADGNFLLTSAETGIFPLFTTLNIDSYVFSSLESVNIIPETPENNLIIGASFSPDARLTVLDKSDLPGFIRFGGIWVSKLEFAEYQTALDAFLQYARNREEKTIVQINLEFSDSQLLDVLNKVKQSGTLWGINLENEPDLFDFNGVRGTYSVEEYIAWVKSIIPVVRSFDPGIRIIAGDFSSLTHKDDALLNDWILPFLQSDAAGMIDYFGPHYYPFTGGQKLYESAYFTRKLRSALALFPNSSPPILLGETNTTYNSQEVYPGSGGDSFLAAISFPEIFASGLVKGALFWSMYESPPSTLGLFDENLDKRAYSFVLDMLRDIEASPIESSPSSLNVTSTAFQGLAGYTVFLKNESPFFERGTTIAFDSQTYTLDLVPLSLTELKFGSVGEPEIRRMSYRDRVPVTGPLTDGEKSMEYVAPLLDPSEPNLEGLIFVDPTRGFNQNLKITTGADYVPISSPDSIVQLSENQGVLQIDYSLPATADYYQAGVKLFLSSFELEQPTARHKDWSGALDGGSIRIVAEVDKPTDLDVAIENDTPAASTDWNLHHAHQTVENEAIIDLPFSSMAQEPGWGTLISLRDVLSRAAAISIQVKTPGSSGTLKIHKVELVSRY